MPDKLVTNEQDDLALKTTIEASLIVSFARLFSRIARDFRTVYSATGSVLDAEVYKPEVVSILRPSYRRAARNAGKEFRGNVEISYPGDNKEEVEGAIDVSLLRFSEEEPDERSEIIGRTTDSQLRNFVLGTITSSALIGLFPSNAEVAKIAANRFVSASRARSKLIGIQESLNAVEGSRLIEANELSEGDVSVRIERGDPQPIREAFFREWISREDDHVRLTHQAAHGQKVFGTLQPFRVGNSLLMYPGDTSLGASLDEIMGCRCYSATGLRI